MKKIIALLLALACVFALASCAEENPGENSGVSDGTATIEDYTAAIAATNPTKMTIETTLVNESLNVTLNGKYNVVYQVDGTAVITGSYEKLNEPTQSSFKSDVSVDAEVSPNGKVTGEIDATVSAAAVNKINLDSKKFSYEISMGTLKVTISAANTESVLGVKIDSEVTLIISMNKDGSKIGSYSINYSTVSGRASIVCMYE